MATLFAIALCKLFTNTDKAVVITADTTPAAAAALRGKSDENAIISESTAYRNIPQNTPYPAFARLYYLPPGNPGASAVNIGPAEWIHFLAKSRWVPAAAPGAPSDAPATLILRPSDVRLPKANSSIADADMPTARLPASILSILSNLPHPLCDIFAWGTVKPAPPLERLVQISKQILAADKALTPHEVTDAQYYDELVGIWRSLALAK